MSESTEWGACNDVFAFFTSLYMKGPFQRGDVMEDRETVELFWAGGRRGNGAGVGDTWGKIGELNRKSAAPGNDPHPVKRTEKRLK